MDIPSPNMDLQEQFKTKIDLIESQNTLINQSISHTQTLLDATMDKYFG